MTLLPPVFWRNTENEYLRDFRGSGGNGRLLAIGVYVGNVGDEHEKVLSYVTPTKAGATTTPTSDWVLLHDLGVAVPCAQDGNPGDVCPIPSYKSWRLRSDRDTLIAPSCPWLRLMFEMPSGIIEQEVVSYDMLGYTHQTMSLSGGADEAHAVYSIEKLTPSHLITHHSHSALVASAGMLRAAEQAESLAKKAATVAAISLVRFLNVTSPELMASAEKNEFVFEEGIVGMIPVGFQISKVAHQMISAESHARNAAGEAARLLDMYRTRADHFVEDTLWRGLLINPNYQPDFADTIENS